MRSIVLLAATALALLPGAAAVPMKLAAAQVLTNDGDFDGNLHRVSTAVAAAAQGGAELVAFPETSLDGWMENGAIKVAPPVPGNWSATIGQLAQAHSIWVLIGIVETDADTKKLYDVAILVDKTGRLVMKHRKNNIVCANAGCNYQPGHNVSVASDTPWGRLGILICADTFDEGVVGRMAALQPDILIVPYGFQAPPAENVQNGQELMDRVRVTAKAVGAPMVGVNNVGAVGGNTGTPGHASMGVGNTYCGFSSWADKTGKTMAMAADRDVDLAFWTINTNKR
jgi:predicted amidohydrolase